MSQRQKKKRLIAQKNEIFFDAGRIYLAEIGRYALLSNEERSFLELLDFAPKKPIYDRENIGMLSPYRCSEYSFKVAYPL